MHTSSYSVRNDQGFILVVTMFVLVVLTLIAISATRTSNIELQVAGNEKWSQEAFYQADGAVESTIMVIEESTMRGGIENSIYGDMYVNNLNFYIKELVHLHEYSITSNALDWSLDGVPSGSISKVDMYTPNDARSTSPPYDMNPPYTLLKAGGESQFTPGSALHMASGYEGFGKSAAHGGAQILYDIWSNHYGRNNSEVMLKVQYRHVN